MPCDDAGGAGTGSAARGVLGGVGSVGVCGAASTAPPEPVEPVGDLLPTQGDKAATLATWSPTARLGKVAS